jgi:polyhydroxyalkanoate synthase subunit PhaC
MQHKTSDGSSWQGATPCQRVAETELLNLYAFSEESSKVRRPIIVVYSTLNRANILDFHPKLSVIRQFMHAGLNTYLIDWKDPPSGNLGFADYAEDHLGRVIDLVRRRTGADAVHLFGYCWGGIFALVHAALHPEAVASLTLMATPVDLETEPLATIELWIRQSNVNPDRLVDENGFVPGESVRRAMIMANPIQTSLARWYELLDCSHDPNLVRGYFRGQRWAHDTPPIAGKLFGEVIRNIYQNNALTREKLKVQGNTVRLAAITCPVLSVVANDDSTVSPTGSLRIGGFVLTKPSSVYSFRIPTGHIGLCASVKSHTQAWPKVAHLLASL